MINKIKAQIQMGESIAVLMIFLVLIGLGSIFMVNVLSGSVERTREENMQLKAIDISQKVSFLPELQCSEENIVVEPCIDVLKLDATAKLLTNNIVMNDYYPIFEYSKIEVEQIFPPTTPPNTLTVYDKQDPKRPNEKKIYLPTALYNAIERAYHFGWIIITVYS